MALTLVDWYPYPLLTVVVAWATCLFCGYGLLSETASELAVGALATASALQVIVDLSGPYSGLFQVSLHPLTDVLKAVGPTRQ